MKEKDCCIYYISISEFDGNNNRLEEILDIYPDFVTTDYRLIKNDKKRRQFILGKFLLREAVIDNSLSLCMLKSIELNEFGKPYFTDSNIHFNISHSSDLVVCAISKDMIVGIDIEERRVINIGYFHSCFSRKELEEIYESGDIYSGFFRYWTIKESILKATGTGLSFPLNDLYINYEKRTCIINDIKWYINEIDILDNYACHLSTNEKPSYLKIRKKVLFF